MRKPNLAHNLLGATSSNWKRIKKHNTITPEHRDEARLIDFVTGLLALPAHIEHRIYDRRINKQVIKDGPVFVVGFWRSGTTFLQNLLTRDPQFGWFDPVSTITFSNSIMMRPLLAHVLKRELKGARPMDNMDYTLDLPMEDVFALGSISEVSITNMLVFPDGGKGARYIETAFIDEQPQEVQDEWKKAYDYVLKKVTYICHGKPLLLKSPEHTCRIAALKKNYPESKFINIYRNPYDVVVSTVNMFELEMGLLSLNTPATHDVIVDICIDLFARVYKKAIKEIDELPEGDVISVKYEDFCADKIGWTKKMYDTLGLDGYEKALPYFKKYIDSQKNYKKNHFEIDSEVRRKINEKLGFYFEKYGYEMVEP